MLEPERSLARHLETLSALLAKAKALGAEAADAVLVEGRSLAVAWRLGRSEGIERAEAAEAGLRVVIGKRQALASSTDLSPGALDELAERAVAMANSVPEDPFCGLAEPDELARAIPSLELCDAAEPLPEALFETAREAEEAALAVAGVTNSEGASAAYGLGVAALATTTGFNAGYAISSVSVSASVIAGEGAGMERDYEHAAACFRADLESAAAVGRRAGERAVARLKPRKARSAKVPVVYDPRVANGLLRHFAGAINGAAIARGTSFLKDRLGEPVFAPGIAVIDDPLRARGLASRPFDGEGVATRRRTLIDDGRLTGWLLDCRSARQLGLKPTGNAGRGAASLPQPASSNLYLAPGRLSPAELMADLREGFYVTELIGMGVNGITGDYSRGAAGFWIENGSCAYPVSEVTVAGNLKEMFARLTPADDLVFRYGINAPTLRIEGMTVAGR